MDLPTRDRAPADVAPLPPRKPGVPLPGGERGTTPQRRRRRRLTPSSQRTQGAVALLILVALAALAWHFNAKPRHDALSAVPDTARTLVAATVRFAVGGFGLVRLLLPA